MKNFTTLVLLSISTVPFWVLYFISKLIPRDQKTIVFGTHTASFSGNIKALFLQYSKPIYKKVFISSNKPLIQELNKQGYIAYSRYSLKGIYHSLRAGVYIYSSYPSDINFWLSNGAKYINVWHGTPIKKIERDVTTGKYSLRNRYPFIFRILKPALFAKPDLLLVSSPHEERCFKSAFGVSEKNLFRSFPPRLVHLPKNPNMDPGKKNILYTPTWRDDHSFDLFRYLDSHSLNSFLQSQNAVLFIKLHPSDRTQPKTETLSNIRLIDKNEDVYGYLDSIDLLISDYSSMVFEALYLSIPALLFCPDYETYQTKSREFYIDPCSGLPVRTVYSQVQMEHEIASLLRQKDSGPEDLGAFTPFGYQEELLDKMVKKAYER